MTTGNGPPRPGTPPTVTDAMRVLSQAIASLTQLTKEHATVCKQVVVLATVQQSLVTRVEIARKVHDEAKTSLSLALQRDAAAERRSGW